MFSNFRHILICMRVVYNDKWLRIISYPCLGVFIRHFGEMSTMGELLKTPLYYFDILFDTLIVILCWEANRKLILYLDQEYPWERKSATRLALQPLIALPMTFTIVIPMVYLYNEVLTDHGSFNTANLLVMDLPLTLVFTVMIHMIYTGMYFNTYYTDTIAALRNRVRELESSVAGVRNIDEFNATSPFRKLLVVNFGSASVPIETEKIAYIYKQNELSFIRTFDGKEYTSSYALDNFETQLDPRQFFRINRQILANQKSIKQFKNDSGGKLQIELTPNINQDTSISRKKSAEFKAWVGQVS